MADDVKPIPSVAESPEGGNIHYGTQHQGLAPISKPWLCNRT